MKKKILILGLPFLFLTGCGLIGLQNSTDTLPDGVTPPPITLHPDLILQVIAAYITGKAGWLLSAKGIGKLFKKK